MLFFLFLCYLNHENQVGDSHHFINQDLPSNNSPKQTWPTSTQTWPPSFSKFIRQNKSNFVEHKIIINNRPSSFLIILFFGGLSSFLFFFLKTKNNFTKSHYFNDDVYLMSDVSYLPKHTQVEL